MTREEIHTAIRHIMMKDGPDGHTDGSEFIADFVVALQEGRGRHWISTYMGNPFDERNVPNFDAVPISQIEKRMDEMRQYPLTMDEVFPTTMPTVGLTADCGSVDGKNPGIFKFRIVDIASKTILEEHIIPGRTTNNVAEYLGCVWAMRHNKINNLNLPVYTDSRTARSWIKKKGCRTTLEITDKDQRFMIAAANMFLKDKPSIPAPLFWSTEEWGDIPADYGMKPPRKPKE